MKKIVLLFGVLLLIGCSKQDVPQQVVSNASQQSSVDIRTTVGYKLLSQVEGKAPELTDARIADFNGKINLISDETGIASTNILDILLKAKDLASAVDIWEILEAAQQSIADKAYPLKSENTEQGLRKYLVNYLTMRISFSHKEALESYSMMQKDLKNPDFVKKIEDSIDLNFVALDLIKNIDQAFIDMPKVAQNNDIKRLQEIERLFEKDLPMEISLLSSTKEKDALLSCVNTGKAASRTWSSIKANNMGAVEKGLSDYEKYRKGCLIHLNKG